VTTPRPNVLGLAAWREGLLEVQDEGSQLLGEAVAARPGEAVLDACAGAGGKTLLLAAAVGAAGRVHAADPDAERLVRLRARAARAGVLGAELERIPPAVDASVVTGDGFLRTWPHRHGTDAFFAAAWTRRC
jgi:16S rRNA C967 or C1407 C5-methylase (RsmB/RsmF family)